MQEFIIFDYKDIKNILCFRISLHNFDHICRILVIRKHRIIQILKIGYDILSAPLYFSESMLGIYRSFVPPAGDERGRGVGKSIIILYF